MAEILGKIPHQDLWLRLKSHGFGLLKMEPFEMCQPIKGESTRICDIKSTL